MLIRRIAFLLVSAVITATCHAQALPAATRSLSFEAGGGISIASPDYSFGTIKGFSVFGAADLRSGIGIDVEYHDTNLFTPHDIGEKTFLVGLRYGRHERRFYPYIKGLAGEGTFTFQQGYYPATTSSNYTVFAFGGGLEYRASQRIMLRLVDAEYQDWTTFSPSNLTPIVYTFGAAYHY